MIGAMCGARKSGDDRVTKPAIGGVLSREGIGAEQGSDGHVAVSLDDKW
jgi:hypothetical protein